RLRIERKRRGLAPIRVRAAAATVWEIREQVRLTRARADTHRLPPPGLAGGGRPARRSAASASHVATPQPFGALADAPRCRRREDQRVMSRTARTVLEFLGGRPLVAIAAAAVVVAVLVLTQTRSQDAPVTHRQERVALTDAQQMQLGEQEYAKTLR